MTSLNRLIGLPVIYQGRNLGQVERGTLDESGKYLLGLVVRSGIRGARWIKSNEISALGGVSVVSQEEAGKLPKVLGAQLGPVWDTSGLRLGMVTDAYLDGRTGQVTGLEISLGPLDDFRFGRMLTRDYVVRREREQWKVLTPLSSLTPLSALGGWGKEESI